MTEADIQRKIQKICREENCYVTKNNGNMFTEVGRPDLFICAPIPLNRLKTLLLDDNRIFEYCDTVGIFIAVETKRPGHMNEVSEAQKIVMKNIKNAGGIGLFSDSPEQIKALIKHLKGK